MSEFFENENISAEEAALADAAANPQSEEGYVDEFAGFDSIFADPAAHNDKAPKSGNKKRILAITASVLAVAVLAGGTLAVIKLIPEKEDDTSSSSSPFEAIKLLSLNTDDITKATVTNSKGSFVLLSEKEETESSSSSSTSEADVTTVWYAQGVDKALVSSSSISSIVSAAASVEATRKIETMTAEECGLTTPKYTVSMVHSKGESTLKVGDNSLDGTGTYVMLGGSDDIYLTDGSDFSALEFELLDLADTAAIKPTDYTVDLANYKDDQNGFTTFDSLNISGKKYPQEIKILPNTDDSELASYLTFLVKAPLNRPANNVDKVLALYTSGISASGAYSFDVSASSLAAVGLNNPDIIITMGIKGEQRSFKISKAPDGDYAVIADGSVMIKRVAASDLEIAGYGTEDYYSTWVFMQSINELSNFSMNVGGTDYSFDIKYDSSEEAEEPYIITSGGKKLTAEHFQDFYQIFVGLQCSDFTTENLTAAPEATVTLTYSADNSKRTLTFTKATAAKYQYAIDGIPMGRITSSAYNKLIKNLKLAAQDKPTE